MSGLPAKVCKGKQHEVGLWNPTSKPKIGGRNRMFVAFFNLLHK